MSIAAAENAGLGPCDLPLSDPWVTHTTQTSAGVCSLPLSSPASLTAAVAVSSAVSIGGNYLQSNSANSVLLHQHQVQQIQQQTSAVAVLQHSPQAKIMNAVATAVPCPTPASSRKIRRKTDNKPQSQINKCNNEKRRRELENNYIEQLGEFLQLNKRGDMTSTKPDKAAILNQVVKTYRDICDKGSIRDSSSTSRCNRCPTSCADTCTLHPVQQGEVSSTEPPIPESSRVNGQPPEISAYFEALEHYISCVGWVLLQINTEGIIESCTKNIKDLIGYDRSELHKQPIYSYLHTGDHNKLGPILSNISFQLGWGSEQEEQHHKNRRGITAKVRMLVKHPEGSNETMEQKQQRQDKYEEVVLIAAPVRDDGDDSSTVLCLITRPEEESSVDANMHHHTQQRSADQLTLKLEKGGKILQVDANDFRPSYQFIKEVGRSIQEVCHIQDWHRLQAHLKEVYSSSSQNTYCFTSAPFRLRLGAPDAYVHVKANSRLFPNTTPGETDYIMCILTVLNGNDLNSHESNSSTASGIGLTGNINLAAGMNQISSLPSTSHHHTSTTSVGGPLMTSVINGTVPQVQMSPRTSSVVTTFSSPPSVSESTSFFPESFDLIDFPWDSRPDSRTSVTPVSTSRPPSVQAYSPAGPTVCSSPLTQYHTTGQGASVSQPSPQSNNNGNLNIVNNNNNNNAGFHNFGFTGFDDKDQKDHLNNNNSSSNNNHNGGGPGSNSGGNQNHDSERLRNLLTVKRSQANASSSSGGVGDDQDSRNTHRILKGLLNADEDKDGTAYAKLNTALTPRLNAQRPRPPDSKNNENPMLLQMLNDKSDESISQSELLRQLKREDTPKDHNTTSNSQSNQYSTEELKSLLRIKGNDYISRKRPHNEPDDGTVPKRSEDKPSQLREKNKMLASLLENPSKAPPPTVPNPVVKIIPDIPSRVSSSTAVGPGPPTGVGTSGVQSSMLGIQNKPPTPGQPQATTTTNLHANPSARGIRKPSDAYLNQPQMQPHTTEQAKNQLMLNQAQSPSTSTVQRSQAAGNFASSLDSSPYASSTTATSSSPSLNVASSSSASKQLGLLSSDSGIGNLAQHLQTECDPELSKILNDFIDFVPDFESNQSVGSSTTPVPTQEEIAKRLAINEIEKSLMQFENNTFSSSPPAYPIGLPQQGSQAFQPPPVYQNTQRARLAQMTGLRQQQFQRERLLQQQQKERLLQQQQKQRMVVPESATACADQLSLNPGMSNIGSLLNTVAPNVSLARSTLPDSQLSPGFAPNLMQQQLSPSQRGASFSPQQGQGYPPSFPNNAQRLSPQQQQQLSQHVQQQQQQISFGAGNSTNANAQLSPRQPPFNVAVQPVSGAVVSSAQAQANPQWNLGNSRISLQQHNPMLSAQLQSVGYNPRQFQSQRRSLNSPGATVTRQNSFQGQDGFAGPPSPSTQGPFGATTNVFNNQQLQRMQRQSSVPQATQHLPGSPRSFGGSDYGMMYNNMQHAVQGPPPPNDFYGRTQTGNGMNSSEYVRQELRAVVSGRTQQTANNGTVPGGGGGVNAGGTGMRTPQSPLGGLGQGPMVGGNNTNAMGGMTQSSQQQQQQSQQTSAQQQIPGNGLLNTPDGIFNFDNVPDFFGGNSTR